MSTGKPSPSMIQFVINAVPAAKQSKTSVAVAMNDTTERVFADGFMKLFSGRG
ncbi:hypothetical protein QN362_13610 [Actimicrobium sp. CCC2.4]|uniref:hypothetical protein n=1 Tax=Actimicrobium sp. CCC2.4 TaxID=3048606 RepID=UPI002AC945D3|nr:hypothetical protein [Actimicrobium sp. CCC2.4]MEB0136374.1 hypothetical protein [Actimicrobium sp. CCC2.4]WPX31193.1 hypothetical protein RHM62_13165 [Actimicrobium sp. CCC2.4]